MLIPNQSTKTKGCLKSYPPPKMIEALSGNFIQGRTSSTPSLFIGHWKQALSADMHALRSIRLKIDREGHDDVKEKLNSFSP